MINSHQLSFLLIDNTGLSIWNEASSDSEVPFDTFTVEIDRLSHNRLTYHLAICFSTFCNRIHYTLISPPKSQFQLVSKLKTQTLLWFLLFQFYHLLYCTLLDFEIIYWDNKFNHPHWVSKPLSSSFLEEHFHFRHWITKLQFYLPYLQ